MPNQLNPNFHVYRIKNGILLIDPNHDQSKSFIKHNFTGHTLESLLSLPNNIYFLDQNSTIIELNNEALKRNRLPSKEAAIGKTVFDLYPTEIADPIVAFDKKVIETNMCLITDDSHSFIDGTQEHYLTIKSPWYDEKGAIIGIFGFSIALGLQPLAASLLEIKKLGLLNSDKKYMNISEIIPFFSKNLTVRELEYLPLISSGKTTKEIAHALKVSPRTAEKYLELIKFKLNAFSKSNLIEIINKNLKS